MLLGSLWIKLEAKLRLHNLEAKLRLHNWISSGKGLCKTFSPRSDLEVVVRDLMGIRKEWDLPKN